eukprot:CAMPEP_0175842068 /NCGR_PEP_ID=MMETSP0107_2-20121207/20286_1 /TAXON_ID=195067 ORGANISM="Goniomonas pacifica, Strain CCMP1869" /NCGR_SAMPLE_ID=MMETSP0107_2 /ASSEMBLY_ACC=CAM_ASM_000203 /LENGTH=72 /DNA_ID=CAMNT_0017156119 /DNA_START=166 /DNA_END=384 /DNA_ORIENTATION=+
MTAQQAPQHHLTSSTSVDTASCRTSFSPWLTALKMAMRSAQQVSPNEAFSTFVPQYTFPLPVKQAAPTRNLL